MLADDQIMDSTLTDNGESAALIGYAIGNPVDGKRQFCKPKTKKTETELEAERIKEAQLARYQTAILEKMPTQADRKRMPATKSHFEKLCFGGL